MVRKREPTLNSENRTRRSDQREPTMNIETWCQGVERKIPSSQAYNMLNFRDEVNTNPTLNLHLEIFSHFATKNRISFLMRPVSSQKYQDECEESENHGVFAVVLEVTMEKPKPPIFQFANLGIGIGGVVG